MNVDQTLWDEMTRTQNFDKVNAAIQQHYMDKTTSEVLAQFKQVHQRLLEKLDTLSDADLYKQIFNVQPDYKGDRPLIGLIIDDTYGHFEEHLPWMQAIASGSAKSGA